MCISLEGLVDFFPPDVLRGTFVAGSDAGAYLCYQFTIADDNCVEYKELFEVYLASNDPDVVFQNHIYAANVSITDNDCECLNTCIERTYT